MTDGLKIIAHRGAAGATKDLENTLQAIKACLELGVDAIEIDVRVAPGQISGIPVLKHDTITPDDSKLATLEAVIKLVNRRVPLFIEVKPDEPIDPVIGVIARAFEDGWTATDFRLASKSHNTLRELHTAFPEVPTVVIEAWSSIRAVYHARQLDTKFLAMNRLWLWSGVINSLARRGYLVSAYTLNDPAKARRWAKSHLYAVITDYPGRFK